MTSTRPTNVLRRCTGALVAVAAVSSAACVAAPGGVNACSAGVAAPARYAASGASGTGVSVTVDPDALPGLDLYGIHGPEAATLKRRVDAIAGTVSIVVRKCMAFTGAPPDRVTVDTWLLKLRSGTPASTLAAQLAAGDRFRRNYAALGTTDFVKAAYRNALGYSASSKQVSTAATRLNSGKISRSAYVAELADSSAAVAANANLGYVVATYAAITTVAPSSSDLERFVAQLDDHQTRVQVVEDIALTRKSAAVWNSRIDAGATPRY